MKRWQKTGLKAATVVFASVFAVTGVNKDKRADTLPPQTPPHPTVPVAAKPKTVEQIKEQARDDTFAVIGLNGALGTAERIVDREGRDVMLTNNHVVNGLGGPGSLLRVVDRKGKTLGVAAPCEDTPDIEQLRIAAGDAELDQGASNDFGILCVDKSSFSKQNWAEFTKAQPLVLAVQAPKGPVKVLLTGFPDTGYDQSEGVGKIVPGTSLGGYHVDRFEVRKAQSFAGASGSSVIALEGKDKGKIVAAFDSGPSCDNVTCYKRKALDVRSGKVETLQYTTLGWGAPIENVQRAHPYTQEEIDVGYQTYVRDLIAQDMDHNKELSVYAALKEKQQHILQHERALKAEYPDSPEKVAAEMNAPMFEGGATWSCGLKVMEEGMHNLEELYGKQSNEPDVQRPLG